MHLLLLLPLLFLLSACFLPPRTQAGEIIGGHNARPHSRPYMACLKKSKLDPDCFCGGFLIKKDFLLTAAHCNDSMYTVILGAHDISKKERTQQVITVSRAIPHPNYNSENLSNDIMLLKLKKKVKLTNEVKPISLPTPEACLCAGQVCSVAGWGQTENEDSSSTLQEVELTLQEETRCKYQFKSGYNKATQLCVGDPANIYTTFWGDSGGPLVCNNVAQGIVSHGPKEPKPPVVYTKISSFLPWIHEVIKASS
ncbi:granzyme B(G,H)-like [Erinaceus europaeus]|uniref:Granzyme B(G,H)-like n=1 Tax=Erinaceus europaeus TaxID=9365 RepID=A0A1S3AM98_ERIEU|nr:granzyme B(G,H)-like [Erinaceus europaeus]